MAAFTAARQMLDILFGIVPPEGIRKEEGRETPAVVEYRGQRPDNTPLNRVTK